MILQLCPRTAGSGLSTAVSDWKLVSFISAYQTVFESRASYDFSFLGFVWVPPLAAVVAAESPSLGTRQQHSCSR